MTQPNELSAVYTEEIHEQLWEEHFSLTGFSKHYYTHAFDIIKNLNEKRLQVYLDMIHRRICGHKYSVVRRKVKIENPIVADVPYLDAKISFVWDKESDFNFDNYANWSLCSLEDHRKAEYEAGLDKTVEFEKKRKLILNFKGKKQEEAPEGMSKKQKENFAQYVAYYGPNERSIVEATIKFFTDVNFDGKGEARVALLIFGQRSLANHLVLSGFDAVAIEAFNSFAKRLVALGVFGESIAGLIEVCHPTGLRLKSEHADEIVNLVNIIRTHR